MAVLFAGIPDLTVYRGMAGLALPLDTPAPYVLFRQISNSVEAMQRGRALVTLQVGVEGRVAVTGSDGDLDTLLVALRTALGLGEFAPFDGLVTRSSGANGGVVLGETKYLFPAPGETTMAVQFVITFRFLESYT